MGGKTWSKEEERMFWGVIVPQSRAAAYPNPKPDDDVKWVQLAQLMQELAGDKARRIYTDTMLCKSLILLRYLYTNYIS